MQEDCAFTCHSFAIRSPSKGHTEVAVDERDGETGKAFRRRGLRHGELTSGRVEVRGNGQLGG